MAEDDVLPPDVRDEALARALEVEPLDELTRRRLVSAALSAADDRPEEAETPAQGTARARVFGIAAAAVAFVVLGVAALTLPGGDTADVANRAPQARSQEAAPTPTTAAGGSPTSASGSPALGGASTDADANSASAKTATTLPDLGQLGDLSATGSRARVVATAEHAVAGVEPQQWSLTFQSCPPQPLTIVATGLGSIDGDPVQVVVSRRDDGSLRVRAIDGSTCKLRSLP